MTKRYKKYKRKIDEIIWLTVSAGAFAASCIYTFYTAPPLRGIYVESSASASPNYKEKSVYADMDISAYEYQTETQENTADANNIETETENGDNIEDTGDISDIINTDDFEVEAVDIDGGEFEEDDVEWRYRLTESELNLIAALATLEDSGAVAAISEVILNRLESGKFGGSTVDEVIYEKGQFYAAKFINGGADASEEAVEAVLSVFRDGVSTVGDAEFFAEKSVNPEKIAKGLYLIDNIGDTNFYGQK